MCLTLGGGGAADDVAQFGLQAGVGDAGSSARLEASRPQRHHTLQRDVRPQTLTLVDGQSRGVIDQHPAVLKTHTQHTDHTVKMTETANQIKVGGALVHRRSQVKNKYTSL